MEFRDYETKGRAKLKNDFSHAKCEMMYEFTEDKYDHVDCYATAETGQKYSIEIKDRDIPIKKYEEDGYILELIKYKALMEDYDRGYKPIYRNYFTDGVLTWNVAEIENALDRVEKKWCTETTVNYGKKRVLKDVIMLKKDEVIGQNRNHRKDSKGKTGRTDN